MPSERRTSRGRRSRSKSRALRGERIRLRACEAENLSMASPPGSSSPGRQAVMAAMPQASWRTPLRGLRRAGTRYSVVKTWAQKHLRLLMLAGLALLLLGYYLSPGFSDSVSPSQYVQWSNENASGQSLEKTSAWEALLSFFFPTTCIPKENQVVKPCNELQDLNQSACLGYKCCYSFGISNFSCFAPLKDKPTQMFRMFGLSVISMIILGCLPIYCCSLCRRSKWGNHLRRKVNRILKGLKKQRNKLKEDTEVLGAIMEDEEGLGDEKEQN
ncbi:FMR1 neighbor protein isoform X3 [Diceros bicornis minor]|uniref:FMR1 neighbor protein isoform X3 n=1 Tax=Diceros bicornis minor TaxID=77932 RepID=UPI0026EFA34D|nr:FMR1 neighbor protein isoform X3 [Diceros bicornis minor]